MVKTSTASSVGYMLRSKMKQQSELDPNHGITKQKHYKEAFQKISPEKREKIHTVAAGEFAKHGLRAANINIIAKKAGVSIGSMYNYFNSKEDLFLTVMDYGYQVLEQVISEIDLEKGDIFDKIERLLRAAQKYTREYPELNQIYLDITSQGLSHLSTLLSRKMETISAQFYRSMLTESKKSGTIDPDLDEYIASFCLDNLILLLQYSYTTDYFRERMKIFAGEDAADNDEKIIQGMMHFIRNALSSHPRQNNKKAITQL
jgi:AcrR family transcriptional regulator